MSRTVIVLGAGMVGVSCALALQKRGLEVTLIDRREPGRETSYGNAGVISRSSIMPLNNPGLWKNLPKYLGNRHAAVRYRLGHLLANPGWLLGFLNEARPERLAPRVAALESLVAPALPLHKRLMTEAGIAWRLHDTGFLELWRSEAGIAAAEARRTFLEDRDVRVDVLDRQALSALEPSLNPIFSAALHHKDSASVDWPGAVVEAYAALFAARGGTILRDEVIALSKQGEGWRVTGKAARLWELTRSDWDAVLAVNVIGPVLFCKAVVPGMLARQYGRIVNIASIAGKEGNPNASAYSASKAGVIGLTKSLGKELAGYNIAVNAITPAAARTRIFDQMKQEHIDYMLSKIPRGRFLEVEEAASMVAWLVSAENSFTTASVFDLSGGRATY